jgi:hypothetical protein
MWLSYRATEVTGHANGRLDLPFVLALVIAFGICSSEPASSASDQPGGLVPARLTAHSRATRHSNQFFTATRRVARPTFPA